MPKSRCPRPAQARNRRLNAHLMPVRVLLGIEKPSRNHTVLELSPDPRGGTLSRPRDLTSVAPSTRSRRPECPRRTRSGPSPRVWSAGTWVFGHWEADPAPYGARTVTRSTRGGAQPTLYPKNRCHKRLGRRRLIRLLKRGARSNGIAQSVGAERSVDKRTPRPQAGGVW